MAAAKTENMPTVIVLFGATGDLAARKVIPALFHLHEKRIAPDRLHIAGFSRQDLSNDDFRRVADESLRRHKARGPAKPQLTSSFLDSFSYVQGIFQEKKDYERLKAALEDIDKKWGVCTNKLFYLAVPPQFYGDIFKNLRVTGLTEPCGDPNWTRVIVEKPFGKNLKTAQKTDRALGKSFKEEQIYRIDHYLGKETVQNILAFRFSNNLFEKNWNKESVEKIEIRLNETIDVGSRGGFYDGVGALRDVGQNHLLQMLALVTMEYPERFDAVHIRARRLAVLKRLKRIPQKNVRERTFRAQYDGYRNVKGVAEKSQTETYFKIRTDLANPRWKGVPVILESGKALGNERKEIVVTFRHPSPCLCPENGHVRNTLTFHLERWREGIEIRFFAKKPGIGMVIEPRTFSFAFHKEGAAHIEEYERLLLDAIRGDQTLFVSTEEVNAMWRFIDPIVRAWEDNLVPLAYYKAGTNDVQSKARKALKM